MRLNWLIILIIFLAIFSFRAKEAKAGQEHNVSGWAWSENVGWISFNCYNDYNGDGVLESHCQDAGYPSNYGVNLNPSTKIFSGYAWSENVGWITFNESELSGCPISPCRAWLDSENKVNGWAKVLANGGGWDGWIRLKDTNYEVSLNPSTNEFEGWAWSDMVVGWVSFNCKDGGYNEATGEHYSVCSTSNYKVFLINQPPTVSNPNETKNLCAWGTSPQVAPGLAITLNWEYSDPEGDSPAGYEVWIDADPNFHNGDPTFKFRVEGIQSTSYVINLSDNQSTRADKLTYPLSWNTTYYWKVKVKDSAGNWSNWSAIDSFITPLHASPYVDFSWEPQRPVLGQIVQFTDLSQCYDSAGNIVPCTSWDWEFQDGNPQNSTNQNPTTTFTSIGQKEVKLRVTDSSGLSCEGSKTVLVFFPLPFWKEVPPILFKIRNFFASLISKIKI